MKFTKISSALIALICAGAMFGSVSASAEELVPMEGNPMSAIHSAGSNQGSLITKYHLQFYHNNPNASYVNNTQ